MLSLVCREPERKREDNTAVAAAIVLVIMKFKLIHCDLVIKCDCSDNLLNLLVTRM